MKKSKAPRIGSAGFALALLIRLGILFGTGLYQKVDRTEMSSVAVTWARTGQFANAYMTMPTGPTAHVAPGYPILMGMVYRLFGDGRTGETVKQVLACVVSAARAPLLIVLAVAFGLGEETALTAGLLSGVYIGALDTELRGDWEGPLASNLLLLLVLWGHQVACRRIPHAGESLVYGVAWGLALLVSPSLAPIAVAFAVLGLAVFGRKAPRSFARALVCFAAGALLALSPWILRNYVTFGEFIWARDNFGLELSVSNGPGANWSNPENQARIYSMHPSRYPPATLQLIHRGEPAFNADRKREALKWISSHPHEFLGLTLQRTFHFWFPPGRNRIHQAALAVFSMAAYCGLVILRRRGSPAFWWIAAAWATYPLLYYIIQWSSRYRQPIDWSLILCVAVAVNEARGRVFGGAVI